MRLGALRLLAHPALSEPQRQMQNLSGAPRLQRLPSDKRQLRAGAVLLEQQRALVRPVLARSPRPPLAQALRQLQRSVRAPSGPQEEQLQSQLLAAVVGSGLSVVPLLPRAPGDLLRHPSASLLPLPRRLGRRRLQHRHSGRPARLLPPLPHQHLDSLLHSARLLPLPPPLSDNLRAVVILPPRLLSALRQLSVRLARLVARPRP